MRIAYALATDLDGVMLPELSSPTVRPAVHLTTPGLAYLRAENVVPFVEGVPILNIFQYEQWLRARVFSPTHYVRRKLEQIGVSSEVARPRIPVFKPCDINLPRKFVCAVFANVPHKDVPMYVQVAKARKDLMFVYVTGEGYWPEYYELKKLQNVVLLTNLHSCEIEQLIKRCSLYLAFSHGEGLGIPPLDAARLGTPILAYGIETYKETLNGCADFIDVEYTEPLKLSYMYFDRVRVLEDVVKRVKLTRDRIKCDVKFFYENELAKRLDKFFV